MAQRFSFLVFRAHYFSLIHYSDLYPINHLCQLPMCFKWEFWEMKVGSPPHHINVIMTLQVSSADWCNVSPGIPCGWMIGHVIWILALPQPWASITKLSHMIQMIQYRWKPPWSRGSMLGLTPPGLKFRILCLERECIISFISPSRRICFIWHWSIWRRIEHYMARLTFAWI